MKCLLAPIRSCSTIHCYATHLKKYVLVLVIYLIDYCMHVSARVSVCVCIMYVLPKNSGLNFPSLICKGKHCREAVILAGLLGDTSHGVSVSFWTRFLYVFIHLTAIYWVPALPLKSKGLNTTERVQARADCSLPCRYWAYHSEGKSWLPCSILCRRRVCQEQWPFQCRWR